MYVSPLLPSSPLVSVTIPVWNGALHIGEALASVLAQAHPALEVIVVDDGSTDGTVEAAQRVADGRCRILRQSRSGPAAARNLGVAGSRGALLAFLDADDVWMREKLALQMPALLNDPTLDMVFGHYVTIGDGNGAELADAARPGYSLGTMLIRRERFLRVGPLSTRWRVGEFVDWYARADEAGLRHAMLPAVVLGRRVHEANLTGREREARADYARIASDAARRRGRLHRQPS
jgi:glycosyltransferase involved in cell wall biosynthesis